jgi:hypothetical protein
MWDLNDRYLFITSLTTRSLAHYVAKNYKKVNDNKLKGMCKVAVMINLTQLLLYSCL